MPRPYTYAGEYPTAHKYSTVYGISQGKKYIDDFRPTRKFKIQIRLKKFLVYEGRHTPTNAYGKRESCNVYGKTYEECEAKLEEMIAKKRAEIAAEKERLKAMQTA